MRTLIAVTLLCPALALAGGTATPNPDPRALGLAEAGIASLNGPEAVSMNAAALAGQKGFAVGGALMMIDNKTTWSDGAGASVSTDRHPSWPPTVSASYGGEVGGMAWGAGVGFYGYGGGSLHWPEGWAGQYHVQDVTQQIVQFRAGAGLEVLKGVKLGASVVYVRATDELSQATGFPGSLATVGAAGGAAGWAVSTEIKVPEVPVKFGLEYRSKIDVTLDGAAHFTNVPPPFQPLLQDQSASTRMVVPADLHLGVAVQATEHLELMAAFTYEWWSAWKSDVFAGDKGFTVTVPRDYNDAQIYRLGVEYAHAPALAGFTLRAGVMRSVSKQPTDTLSPSLSDASSWGGSVGLGYQATPGLSFDAAFQHSRFDKVTASGAEAFPGSYVTTANLVSVGLTWRL